MDKLKQYLQTHRQQMDVEIPPTDLLPYIQAGAVGPAANTVLTKYIIGISLLAVVGAGAWLLMHKQEVTSTPPPVTPPKEVIQKDTVPVQKDTMPATPVQPVIQHKKIPKVLPTQHVIRKHKKSVDTVVHPIKPRPKKTTKLINHPTKPHPKKKAQPPISLMK